MDSPKLETTTSKPTDAKETENDSDAPSLTENTSVDNGENATPENQTSCNPTLPEGEDNETLERLRGDAIGNTLYSERFVISTILKLQDMKKDLADDNNYEKELESLWDMTVEMDVVLKLMELDVYDVFAQSLVKYKEDDRLKEILIGIMANMCTVSEEALELLCKNEPVMEIILRVVVTSDRMLLIQIMRFITTVYGSMESARIWTRKIIEYESFMTEIGQILSNSLCKHVLGHTLEALNAILAKCATMDDFLNDDEVAEAVLPKITSTYLVKCTLKAFKTFFAREIVNCARSQTDDFVDTDTVLEPYKKTMVIFINIHDILMDYRPKLYDDYCTTLLASYFDVILRMIATTNLLLPANIDYLQDILETLHPIYMSNKFHDEQTPFRLIILWHMLKTHTDKSKSSSNGFESDDEELNEIVEELYELTKEMLNEILKKYTKTLETVLKNCTEKCLLEVFTFYGVKTDNYKTEDFEASCKQLATILQGQKQES